MPRRALLSALFIPLLLTACVDQTAPDPGPVDPGPITPPDACRVLPASAVGAFPQSWPQVAANWNAPHVAGQVLILTDAGTGRISAQALSAQFLSVLAGVQMQAVAPGVQLAQTPAAEGDQAFAGRLTAAGVRTQPNYVYRSLALPNDPAFPGNAGLKVATASVNVFQNYLTRIGAPAAWAVLEAVGKTPVGAKVAVLDSAPDRSHPELGGRLSASVSCLDPAASGGTVTAISEHGTEVTGLIGANTGNGVGLAGVVWSGPLLGIEVLDGNSSGSTVDLARGLKYAVQQGAAVVNISLGVPGRQGDAVLDAALTAAAKTAVVVAAAGNSANEGVYYPASHPDVIAVGAVGLKDTELACYSARPSAQLPRALDIVAPGGVGVICAGFKPELDLPVLATGGGYKLAAGTSFSAPMVSGVVALMRGANPGLSAAQTRALLLGSVNRSGGLPVLDAAAAVRSALK
ncbi:S8 family peptidase [Deinococcus arenicola]|uniref:S8 family serine peptidase n=1 Tax=Deinococcus arenicola TaxID=2994950 RepID=A0ABU4DM47_9DEIO|nr:S8 family serine peptidase [Deinococcus sp. ZS9-10]MDV6373169.1 S8 family serine peptidase [Deinococcus sp. ZS9-10]